VAPQQKACKLTAASSPSLAGGAAGRATGASGLQSPYRTWLASSPSSSACPADRHHTMVLRVHSGARMHELGYTYMVGVLRAARNNIPELCSERAMSSSSLLTAAPSASIGFGPSASSCSSRQQPVSQHQCSAIGGPRATRWSTCSNALTTDHASDSCAPCQRLACCRWTRRCWRRQPWALANPLPRPPEHRRTVAAEAHSCLSCIALLDSAHITAWLSTRKKEPPLLRRPRACQQLSYP
jgi:hypothetical protein